MNKDFSKESITSFFEANKSYYLPVLAIAASIFLTFIFIIPQITAIPRKISEMDLEAQKLVSLEGKELILQRINEETLDADLDLASNALPGDKDFQSILSVLSIAASNSNVILSDYAYQSQVSSVSESEVIPSIRFDVNVLGGPQEVVDFTNELYKSSPVSEIESISITNSVSEIGVIFYFKPFPQIGSSDVVNIRETSERESAALKSISEWNQPDFALDIVVPSSTGSGRTTSSPFD